jgi:prophage antirepressor-like protein
MHSTELIFYQPTQEVDNIITPMIEKFRDSSPEFSLTSLKAYNTSQEPLFKFSDVSVLLGKKNIRQIINEDSKKSPNDRIYTIGKDFVYGLAKSKNGAKRRALFFTRRGFQIYLMTSRGDISNLFRNFLLVILEELHEKGIVSKNDAIRITEQRYQQEIQQIKSRLGRLNIVLEAEQKLRQEVEMCLTDTEIDRDTLKIIAAHQKKKIQTTQRYVVNMEEDFPHSKESELRILKQKYAKPVKIYLVPYEKIARSVKRKKRKKEKKKSKIYEYLSVKKIKELGLEDSSSDEEESFENYVMEYDYSLFGHNCKPHESDSMYYTLSPTKRLSKSLGIYVDDAYITGKNQYNLFVNYAKKTCSTSVVGVFLISLGEIHEKFREIFIQENKKQFT